MSVTLWTDGGREVCAPSYQRMPFAVNMDGWIVWPAAKEKWGTLTHYRVGDGDKIPIIPETNICPFMTFMLKPFGVDMGHRGLWMWAL